MLLASKHFLRYSTCRDLCAYISLMYPRFYKSTTRFHAATHPARAFLVQGKPLLDDFTEKFTSSVLKVSMSGTISG